MTGATITALVSAVLAIAALLLKQWQANQPKRDQEKIHAETQRGRLDIANGDTAAVNGRIDRLLSDTDGPAGEPGGAVTPERISAVLGMADAAGSPGADTGKSGTVQ